MGDRVWSTEAGSGPLVVLVHGSMDRSTSFARIARHLDGFTVARYDRRGYANSLGLGPPVSVAQQANDLLDVIDGRVARVFGHSLGGVIALAASVRAPDSFERVVAYEAPRSWLPWWPAESAGSAAMAEFSDPEDVAEGFMRRMVGDAVWEKLPPSTREARRAEGVTLIADIGSVRPPHPAPYDDDAIRCKVIAAYGTSSHERHQRAARDLSRAVSDGELRVVDGAAHGAHLSHPAEAAALLVI